MINAIWLLFAAIFFLFALYHFKRAATSIPKAEFAGKVQAINGIPLGIAEFSESFNQYVDRLNKDNMKMNVTAGIGYLLTAGTALASYFLT